MAGITLENKDILDYGFGAGTFFRYCPPGSRLFGVEMDAENVKAVRAMLEARGKHACGFADDQDRALVRASSCSRGEYDVILCSHVLEHIPHPSEFMERIRACLKPNGVFIGAGTTMSAKWTLTMFSRCPQSKIRTLARGAGLRVGYYVEADPLFLLASTRFHPRSRNWGTLFRKN